MPNALIWGASSGMGQALVNLLSQEGWDIHAVARDTSKIPDSATYTYEFDASSPDSIAQACLFVSQQSDATIDLMVYFAGNLAYDKLDNMGYEGWMATMNSNLNGAFLCATESLHLMENGGHLVFIGAYIDHIRLPKMGAYAVAKAGLDELVTILRKENRKMNISIVRPGAVDTPFWEQVSFKKPTDIKAPSVIAQKIFEQYQTGASDDINL